MVLEITHRNGKLSIPDTMIGGPRELEKLANLILAGVKSSSEPKSEPAPKPEIKPEAPKMEPQAEALLRAIREQSKTDPLVGAKIGAKEILQRLHTGMKTEKGIHIESLLCALGALAGYACQANLRAQALAKSMPENAAFQVVETTDGKQYFFGDQLNNALVNDQYSVWSLAGGAAQHAGIKELPDINEMFKHTSSVIGSAQFGIPRTPENHKAADTPLNYLKHMWPALFPTVKQFCPQPIEWPILYGLAIQETITQGKNIIDPALSLTMVMESAIPMSKVDLAKA
ncbi:MAG TPA: hypothetical protein VL381_03905 [Rhodocyclaceae bacterium]|nr:hypothetical protein [Rhodocyclaceae bacterium]